MVTSHHEDKVKEEVKRLNEANPGPKVKHYQNAITNTVAWVKKDKARKEKVEKLVVEWNGAPSREVQIK